MYSDIQEKIDRVVLIVKKVGLKIYVVKIKVMKVKNKFRVFVMVEGELLEEVKDFKYFGSYILFDSNIDKEVFIRIGFVVQVFKKLNNIWKFIIFSIKIKFRIYQFNVCLIFFYVLEMWRINKKLESKFWGFEGRCLWRILKVRW